MALIKRSIKAVTLTELLIVTFIIGIIMLGVVSADYAIRKQNDSAFRGTFADLTAQSIVTNIVNSALLATGTGTSRGVLIGAAGTGDNHTFCIRQDAALTGAIHNPPTTDLSDDRWVCYTVVPGGGSTATLYSCNRISAGACLATDNGYSNIGQVESSGGTNVANAASAVYAQFNSNSAVGAQQMVFTVTVNVADTSSATNKRTVTSSVNPPQHTI